MSHFNVKSHNKLMILKLGEVSGSGKNKQMNAHFNYRVNPGLSKNEVTYVLI